MNTLKTTILLGALTGLLMLIGGYFGGRGGVAIAFIFAIVMNFGAYWFSDKIILRMYSAQEVTETQAPELYTMVRGLAMRASLPMPKVYIIPEETPNAFATGRDEHHAVVAVTEGILRILNADELEGVLAHELTHIKNRDMLIGSIAATLAGAIALFGTIRDRFHARRRDLDRVSLVSWGHVSSWALIVAIVCLAMGLRHPG